MLPSLVSKFAPPAIKGTATGVYSSVQFLGTFVGAAAGGWLSQWHGAAAVVRIRTRADRVVARGQRRHVGAADVQFSSTIRWEKRDMASVNKVILIGNLGRDPETRYTTGGDAITNLNIATSEQWKDKSGEKAGEDRMAPRRSLRPAGRNRGRISQEGPLGVHRRPATDAQVHGQGRVEKYSTEIVGDRMQLLGSREGAGSGDADFGGESTSRPSGGGTSRSSSAGAGGGGKERQRAQSAPIPTTSTTTSRSSLVLRLLSQRGRHLVCCAGIGVRRHGDHAPAEAHVPVVEH
jgi:single-strand DNA-binding protein